MNGPAPAALVRYGTADSEKHQAKLLARFELERRLGDPAPLSAADWITLVRAAFDPGEREVCAVCGGHKPLTQAHHIVPLAQQARDGGEPDQRFAWLCPTHHVAIHLMLSNCNGRASPTLLDMTNEMAALGELGRLLEILAEHPGYVHLRPAPEGA